MVVKKIGSNFPSVSIEIDAGFGDSVVGELVAERMYATLFLPCMFESDKKISTLNSYYGDTASCREETVNNLQQLFSGSASRKKLPVGFIVSGWGGPITDNIKYAPKCVELLHAFEKGIGFKESKVFALNEVLCDNYNTPNRRSSKTDRAVGITVQLNIPMYVFLPDEKWFHSSPLVSLYLLIIRLAKAYSEFRTPQAFIRSLGPRSAGDKKDLWQFIHSGGYNLIKRKGVSHLFSPKGTLLNDDPACGIIGWCEYLENPDLFETNWDLGGPKSYAVLWKNR